MCWAPMLPRSMAGGKELERRGDVAEIGDDTLDFLFVMFDRTRRHGMYGDKRAHHGGSKFNARGQRLIYSGVGHLCD